MFVCVFGPERTSCQVQQQGRNPQTPLSTALGIIAPLSYSVFTAFGAALLLGAVAMPNSVESDPDRLPCDGEMVVIDLDYVQKL